MAWWERNNLRLIQTNLREIDADLDVDRLIAELREFSANTLMMNAGGIFAFYPTRLEHHYRTPYLRKDLLGEAVAKAHEAGMRFIARFDFSKAHESIFRKRPEWFYRTKDGREVNYDGIVHTCINGDYQQEYALKIIDEVISAYPVDGIFFNMFGYITFDYSGNDYGLCHCDNCRRRFRAMTGEELPARSDASDPVYRKYKEFQWATTREILDRIHALVKSRNPDIAVCTYNEHKVDIVRKESNTKLSRPHPVWLYSASENVKSVEDTWEDKLISNCCINAVDLQYRFMGVSRQEIRVRLYESIASGSGLDYCIIGVFDGYPDRSSFPDVRDIFRFHRDHERYFGRLISAADVALVKPSGPKGEGGKEYHGWFKLLKEAHLPFDVLCQHELPANEARLGEYRAIVIPGIVDWTAAERQTLVRLQRAGAHLLATGRSFAGSGGEGALAELFDAELISATGQTDAAYLRAAPAEKFPELAERDWVFIGGEFGCVRFGDRVEKRLPYVPPASFGPPERAYGHTASEYWGAGISRERLGAPAGAGAYVPWQGGALYYRYGYEDHKRLLLGLLDELLEGRRTVRTDAPNCVELFFNRLPEGGYLLQLLNLSGFNGVTYAEPLPIGPIRIRLRGLPEVTRIVRLGEGEPVRWSRDQEAEETVVEVARLEQYAAYALE